MSLPSATVPACCRAACCGIRCQIRPKFPHASATKTTVTGKPQVHVFAPGFP